MSSIGGAVGGRGGTDSLTLGDLQEWLVAMGLEVEAEATVAEQLRDGVLLCQLINKIKSSSVDVVSLHRNTV